MTIRNTGSAALSSARPTSPANESGNFRSRRAGRAHFRRARARADVHGAGGLHAVGGAHRGARLEVPERRPRTVRRPHSRPAGYGRRRSRLRSSVRPPCGRAGARPAGARARARGGDARCRRRARRSSEPTARSRARVRGLTVRPRRAGAGVRAEGLRLIMRIGGDANVVRLRIRPAARREPSARHRPELPLADRQPVRLRLSGAELRRRLAPGATGSRSPPA